MQDSPCLCGESVWLVRRERGRSERERARGLLGDGEAPRALAGGDAAEFAAGFYVDDGNVVGGAVGGEEEFAIGAECDAPGAFADGNGGDDFARDGVEDDDGVAAPGGDVEFAAVGGEGGAHRERGFGDLDCFEEAVLLRVDDRDGGRGFQRDEGEGAIVGEGDRAGAAAEAEVGDAGAGVGVENEDISVFFAGDPDLVGSGVDGDAFGFFGDLGGGDFSAGGGVPDRGGGDVLVGDEKARAVAGEGEFFGIGADVEAADYAGGGEIDEGNPVGGFIGGEVLCAFGIGAGAHAGGPAGSDVERVAVGRNVKAAGTCADRDGLDGCEGGAVDNGDVAGAFVADVKVERRGKNHG